MKQNGQNGESVLARLGVVETWPRLAMIALIVAVAAMSRLLPHPPNFAPIGALGLFGGACFATRKMAFAIPLLALFISDLVLGFHVLVPVVYGSFALNVLIGRYLRTRRRFVPVAFGVLAGAVQFFLVTNFACWVLWYPHTWSGLTACYAAAVPFFRYTLLGDAFYGGVLFGGLALIEARFPVFRERATAVAAT